MGLRDSEHAVSALTGLVALLLLFVSPSLLRCRRRWCRHVFPQQAEEHEHDHVCDRQQHTVGPAADADAGAGASQGRAALIGALRATSVGATGCVCMCWPLFAGWPWPRSVPRVPMLPTKVLGVFGIGEGKHVADSSTTGPGTVCDVVATISWCVAMLVMSWGSRAAMPRPFGLKHRRHIGRERGRGIGRGGLHRGLHRGSFESWVLLVSLVALLLRDWNRWQVWNYIATALFLATARCMEQKGGNDGEDEGDGSDCTSVSCAADLCRTIAACVWLHSGLLKLNPRYPSKDFLFVAGPFVPASWLHFSSPLPPPLQQAGWSSLPMPAGADDTFDGGVGGQWGQLLPQDNRLLYAAAYATAIVEAGPAMLLLCGVGARRGVLRFKRLTGVGSALSASAHLCLWRLPASVLICMHLFISYRLLSMGFELNVIPWNIMFIGLAYFLFWRANEPPAPPARAPSIADSRVPMLVPTLLGPWHVVLALFLVLPLGCHFGAVDSYMSFSMYTGNEPRMWIRVYDSPHALALIDAKGIVVAPAAMHSKRLGIMPRFMRRSRVPVHRVGRAVQVQMMEYSAQELGAVSYPSLWVQQRLAAALCAGENAAMRSRLLFIQSAKESLPYARVATKRHYRYWLCARRRDRVRQGTWLIEVRDPDALRIHGR